MPDKKYMHMATVCLILSAGFTKLLLLISELQGRHEKTKTDPRAVTLKELFSGRDSQRQIMLCRIFYRAGRRQTKLLLGGCLMLFVYWMTLRADLGFTESPRSSGHVSSAAKHVVQQRIGDCAEGFEETFEGNLKVISNYPKGNAEQYLPKIGGNLDQPKEVTSFPVIVTAANTAYFDISKGLLKSVHEILLPKYSDLKIVYYDLGISPEQRTKLEKYCKCEVRSFPFNDFPDHVRRLKNYSWKPIIIQKSLMEFGSLWWLDSSVRFTTDDLDTAMDYAKENGILFFTYGPSLSVAQHTDSQTMQYLQEDVCKFRYFGETEATFGLYHWHKITQILVRTWATCALNENCIAPPGTPNKLHCNIRQKQDGRCHRFDQAILSILTRRLYHEKNDYPDVEKPFYIHEIKRGHVINYFPE